MACSKSLNAFHVLGTSFSNPCGEHSKACSLRPLCRSDGSLSQRLTPSKAARGESDAVRGCQPLHNLSILLSRLPWPAEASAEGATPGKQPVCTGRTPGENESTWHKERLAAVLSLALALLPWIDLVPLDASALAAPPADVTSPSPSPPPSLSRVSSTPPSRSFDLAFLFGESTETTASGRVLPSKYVSTVRDVVARLGESLEADEGDRGSRFREKAEAAKESIRTYLQQWRGKSVAQDVDSALDAALRQLSSFYSTNGPRAVMPAEVKASILQALQEAELAL